VERGGFQATEKNPTYKTEKKWNSTEQHGYKPPPGEPGEEGRGAGGITFFLWRRRYWEGTTWLRVGLMKVIQAGVRGGSGDHEKCHFSATNKNRGGSKTNVRQEGASSDSMNLREVGGET